MWGFPTEEANGNLPFGLRPIKYLTGLFNPMAVLRLSEGLGPFLSRQGGWYLAQKFTGAVEDAYETITQYLYYCNSQSPTGETFFHHTIIGRSNYQCAKYQMVNRLPALEPDFPISFIYGANSWIVREPGRIVKERRIVSTVNLHVITGAGHHVYADTKEKFNELVLGACMETDNRRSAAATAGVGHHSLQTASAL